MTPPKAGERAEPSLTRSSTRRAAQLVRPEHPPQPAAPRATRPAGPEIELTAGERLVVASSPAPREAQGRQHTLLRKGAAGAVIVLALLGAFTLLQAIFGFHLGWATPLIQL